MAREEKMGRFASEEAALLYVERHYIPQGIWTGVQRQPDGSYRLLHDPDEGTSGPRDLPHREAVQRQQAQPDQAEPGREGA